MTGLRLLLASCVIASVAGAAQGAELSEFSGEWKGTGSFERVTQNEQRRGRLTCRLRIEAQGNDVIVIDGRCAAPEGSRGFTTRVTALGGGKLKGEALKGAGAGRGQVSAGTLGAHGFVLKWEDAQGAFMFALGAPKQGRIEMRSSAQEGAKSNAAHVVLRRSR